MLQLAEVASYTVASDYLAKLRRIIGLVPAEMLDRAIECILEARSAGRRIYVMGNGGSAATASHFVCDIVKTAQVPGLAPVRAFALGENAALVTAWANDHAFERVFAEQINTLVEPEDIVIGITASGNSPNIVAGFEAAVERGAWTIAMVGFDGGAVQQMVDVAVHIPCHDYGLVEDTHAAMAHAITAAVKAKLLTMQADQA
jgi:D-sedoheptulose 7-phosphate isomerase